MNLVVMLPDTVDPHMVDQLQAAIQRMGGQIQPDETAVMPEEVPGGPPGAPPGGPPGLPPDAGPPPGAPPVGLDQNGVQGPIPPDMEPAPPMDAGSSNIKRPSSLRRPKPKAKKKS